MGLYVAVASIIINSMLLSVLGYTSRVYRESVGEVITVANVHAKKGAQALIAATTFNKLREVAIKRQLEVGTGGAYWRQSVLDELRAAGMPDVEARGVAQIVAPYGAIKFDKFVDRSASQSQLSMAGVAARTTDEQTKAEGAVPIPNLQPTV